MKNVAMADTQVVVDSSTDHRRQMQHRNTLKIRNRVSQHLHRLIFNGNLTNSHDPGYNINNNNNNNSGNKGIKQRKRKRLNQVVNKLANQVTSSTRIALLNNNNLLNHYNHNISTGIRNAADEVFIKEEEEEEEEYSISEENEEAYAVVKAAKCRHMLSSVQQQPQQHQERQSSDHSEEEKSGRRKSSTEKIAKGSTGRDKNKTTESKTEEMAPLVEPIQVFRFDGLQNPHARYAAHLASLTAASSTSTADEEEEDVFSPSSSSTKSPQSSNTDSPKINLSPLQIKDSCGSYEEIGSSKIRVKKLQEMTDDVTATTAVTAEEHIKSQSLPTFPYMPFPRLGAPPQSHMYPISPVTPLTPLSAFPAPVYSFEHYIHTKYLPDLFRKRSHSDSDVWFETSRTGQVVTEPSVTSNSVSSRSTRHHTKSAVAGAHPFPPHIRQRTKSHHQNLPQDTPLDLSMKTSSRDRAHSIPDIDPFQPPSFESLLNLPPMHMVQPGFLHPKGTFNVPVVKGDVASPTTKESVAVRYNLEVSPVVEEMPPGSDVAYVCPVCGQMFSLHDRLAKHMASRHKSRTQNPDSSAKAYLCEVCNRSFARSDMLTRHMRLHTGVKPYTCRVCGQVFSRSDHLSTHQRTHTGEKPYKCPQCPYAACRRDMITRHMRTHTRYENNNAASEHSEELSSIPGSPHSTSSRLNSPACSSPMDITHPEHE